VECLWCADLLEKRFFRPYDNLGILLLFSLFLLRILTKFQCIEILSGTSLLWLVLLFHSPHLHRHFYLPCGWTSMKTNNSITATCPRSFSCASSSIHVASQGSGNSFWLKANPVTYQPRLRGGGKYRSSSSFLASAALTPSCWYRQCRII